MTLRGSHPRATPLNSSKPPHVRTKETVPSGSMERLHCRVTSPVPLPVLEEQHAEDKNSRRDFRGPIPTLPRSATRLSGRPPSSASLGIHRHVRFAYWYIKSMPPAAKWGRSKRGNVWQILDPPVPRPEIASAVSPPSFVISPPSLFSGPCML